MASVTWSSIRDEVKRLGERIAESLKGPGQTGSSEKVSSTGPEISTYAASDSEVGGSGAWWSKLFKSSPSTGMVGLIGGCGVSGGVGMRSSTVNDSESVGPMRNQRGEQKPGGDKRLMLGNVVFVDDGDMFFNLNGEHDYFTDRSGNRLTLEDRDVQELIRILGMDKERAPILNLKELDGYYKVLEANVAAIKGSTDEAFIAGKYQEIANAACRALIPFDFYSDFDSPLYRRVVAEAGPMGYAIPLGLARKCAEKGVGSVVTFLTMLNLQLAAAETAFAQSGMTDPEFGKKIEAIRLKGFRNAIKWEAAWPNVSAMSRVNPRLDSILEIATRCGILDAVKDDVRRVRVASHLALLELTAERYSVPGWVDYMNTGFKTIEASAAKYEITTDVAPALAKAKRDGYLKAIADVEYNYAKRGWIDETDRSLDQIRERARECGMLNREIAGRIRSVRITAHKARSQM